MTQTATQAALAMALNAPDNERGELLRQIMGVNLPEHKMINLLHRLLDTPSPFDPVLLSVTDRHQRLHYIMSEFLELVEASGFVAQVRVQADDYPPKLLTLNKSTLLLNHVEGSKQDVIEMVDGLEDIMVVSLGMMAEMGQLPSHPQAFREVVAGSVTKLNPDTGKIDKNFCRAGCDPMDGVCKDPSHRPIGDEPVGKWIKGRDYQAPNLRAIIKLPEGYES